VLWLAVGSVPLTRPSKTLVSPTKVATNRPGERHCVHRTAARAAELLHALPEIRDDVIEVRNPGRIDRLIDVEIDAGITEASAINVAG
jgi:hypothetical protein